MSLIAILEKTRQIVHQYGETLGLKPADVDAQYTNLFRRLKSEDRDFDRIADGIDRAQREIYSMAEMMRNARGAERERKTAERIVAMIGAKSSAEVPTVLRMPKAYRQILDEAAGVLRREAGSVSAQKPYIPATIYLPPAPVPLQAPPRQTTPEEIEALAIRLIEIYRQQRIEADLTEREIALTRYLWEK